MGSAAAMAVGKNKRISKGKKGGKKKAIDPFQKKDWYDLKAPSMFSVRNCGKTMVTRTQGTKIASDGLKGRVFEISLGDLNNDEDQAYRKIRLKCEDVQGKNCLLQFHGMDFTTDKLRSFILAFTKKRQNQVKRTCYAQSSQIRQMRKKMVEITKRQSESCDLKELVTKLIPDVFAKEIEKACAGIFPLQNVAVRKCKILSAPKFDMNRLMEVHGDYSGEEIPQPIPRKEEGDAEEAAAEED